LAKVDKDKDGFYVGDPTIPPTLRDPDDNNRAITPFAQGGQGQTGTDTTGEGDFNVSSAGYRVWDGKKEILLNDTTALSKYLRSLGATAIKNLKQSYKSAGLYDGPVNGIVGPSDRIVNLVANALQYQDARGAANETLNSAVKIAIKDAIATGGAGTGGTPNLPRATITTKAGARAELERTFQEMFGVKVPEDVLNSYITELNTLEKSRTTKTKTEKGVEISKYGISQEERQNLIDKYLTQFAKARVANAETGDAGAVAALNKGKFGLSFTTLRRAYADNGIPMTAGSLADQAISVTVNPNKLDSTINLINLQAAELYPALKDKITAGYTVKQLLNPYIQTRAEILEQDPDMVDLVNLSKDVAKDKNGLMSLYDYQISLRNDPQWRYTKNAQDSMARVARGLAETFGLVG